MLRCNAFARVAAGAVHASSTQHVAHLTRALNHLSVSSKLRPVSGISKSIARSFATKVVKRKTTTIAKAKTAVKKKTPTKTKAKAKAKKPVAKKSATKKKTPVRKKVVKKKVVAKPKKKVPTEQQKITAAKVKTRVEITKLKETALLGTAPKPKPENAWVIFVSGKIKGNAGSGGVTQVMKTAGVEYKALAASELEHFNHIANQNKAANEKAYEEWVKSHTPEQIRVANNARSLLKRRVAAGAAGNRSGVKGLNKIKDDRQIKRPSTAYLTFAAERQASGDFRNIKIPDSARLITAEWKALSPAEAKKYTDLYEADKARYQREYQATYGYPLTVKVKAAA